MLRSLIMVNRGALSWAARLCVASAVALLVMAATSGCVGSDPHLYDKVNAVVSELHVSSIGDVIYQGRYGTGGFSSSAPTVVIVVAGPNAYADIKLALTAASFTPTPDNSAWSRDTLEKRRTVHVVALQPGDTYPDAQDQSQNCLLYTSPSPRD